MRPSEFEAIRPHLEQAVDDLDYFLTGLKEQKKVQSELSELYDLIAADKTPPEVKGQGRPELTPEQYAALEWRTAQGEPITDEQREAVLAGVLAGQPISDEGWAALQFALRGGWLESSRQAAAWLRNAGETVAADGIDVALSRLPNEPKDATERSGYREAMRTAAEYVKTILTTCLAFGGVVADGRDDTIEQIRRGVEAFNDRQRQNEAGLERVSRAVQNVTPISETMKRAYLDAMTEHEKQKASQLPGPTSTKTPAIAGEHQSAPSDKSLEASDGMGWPEALDKAAEIRLDDGDAKPLASPQIHASTDEPHAIYRRDGKPDGDPIGPIVGTKTALGYALHNNDDLSVQAYRGHFKKAIASGSAWARKCASATSLIELFLPTFPRRDQVAERLELFSQRESQRKPEKANETQRK